MKSKNGSRFKKIFLGVTAVSLAMSLGISAGCSTSDDDDDDTTVDTKEDTQEILNGNFEFYEDNDGLYPISTPDNWTFSYSGTQSSGMSGIIKTNPVGWEYLTDLSLPTTLEDNDDLDDDDDDKLDYNDALTEDMLFANPHDCVDESSWEKTDYIANPYTHNLSWKKNDDGTYTYSYVGDDGNTDVYVDNDEDSDNYGKLYSDKELTKEIGTSVLMLHNYVDSDYNYWGNEGYYSSSTTITLEANMGCKISLWVKTEELYTANSAGERTKVSFDRGAYIKVDTAVGGNNLDSVYIKNIDTENLLSGEAGDYNGWVQYTVYVEASTFAETTVTLSLGLGQSENNTVEGYAFFDDITFEKYSSGEALEKDEDFTNIRDNDTSDTAANTTYLLGNDAKTSFRADKPTYTNETGSQIIEKNNFSDRYFLINLADTSSSAFTLSGSNTSANLTIDDSNYIASKNTDYTLDVVGRYNAENVSNAKLPKALKNNGLSVENDFVTLQTITSEWSFALSDGTKTDYSSTLTDKLKSAANLPGVSASGASTLVMLSTWGTPYEAEISGYNGTENVFKLADGEYKLISFWMKTSDFNGNTAATVTVVDAEDEDNTSNFTIDTTTETTTSFEDNDDLYDGWVRCFVRVENVSDEDGEKEFKLKVNLGKTTIEGTSETDYFKNFGWIALTNIEILDLNEDTYEYTSDLSHSASLSFGETTTTDTEVFDSEQGDKNEIETNIAIPSSYTGVNGASSSIVPTDETADDYDQTDSNKYAGLINKDNLSTYIERSSEDAESYDWLNKLASIAGYTLTDINDETKVAKFWNDFAGQYTVQPLLVVNTIRKFDNATEDYYNYGYIGSETTIDADSYEQVSVRVKVSEGAIAYIYLVETDGNSNEVMTYSLPEYNFYYDDDGNILKTAYDEDATKKEKKTNIAYTLQEDGLYLSTTDGDDKNYANFWNLEKYYDLYDTGNPITIVYDENGNEVSADNIVQGETYYADANKTKYAPHYLIAGGDSNNKLYKYNSGTGDDVCYNYMEYVVYERDTDDEYTELDTTKLVYGVDKSLAHETPESDTPYSFVVDGNDETYANKWVTVTFYIHTGSESKSYRLELWSGERDKESSYTEATSESYVLFDYSPENQKTVDEDSFSESVTYYEDAIKSNLKEKLAEAGKTVSDNDLNISELEAALAEAETGSDGDTSKLYDYSALYYTFSLYDSSAFVPFNGETAADDESGYDYKYSDYEESLALLKVTDTDDKENPVMAAFVDYSVVDKDIDIIEPITPSDDDDDDDEDTTSETNVWLLVASIVMVAALLVAMIAMLIRWIIRKRPFRKHAGRNNYNFTKNKRYVRKIEKSNKKHARAEAMAAKELEAENAESNADTVGDNRANSSDEAEGKTDAVNEKSSDGKADE